MPAADGRHRVGLQAVWGSLTVVVEEEEAMGGVEQEERHPVDQAEVTSGRDEDEDQEGRLHAPPLRRRVLAPELLTASAGQLLHQGSGFRIAGSALRVPPRSHDGGRLARPGIL